MARFWCAAAGVASGYWDGHGAEQSVRIEQGWYRTGDIGALDEAGNLYFKGRKKEVIVTPGGTNVYPEDLEAALRRQPEVKDCVVVGIERGGNAEPCAVVILRETSAIWRRWCSGRMSRWRSISECGCGVEWPEEDFPRTSTQKPRRNLIQQVSAERHAAATPQRASTKRPLAELIARVTGRSSGRAARGRESRIGSGAEFAGPRGVVECAGGSLPGGSE